MDGRAGGERGAVMDEEDEDYTDEDWEDEDMED